MVGDRYEKESTDQRIFYVHKKTYNRFIYLPDRYAGDCFFAGVKAAEPICRNHGYLFDDSKLMDIRVLGSYFRINGR